jgi:tetratricopeptide (TPR) repeat protein
MRTTFTFLSLFLAFIIFGQTKLLKQYEEAVGLLEAGKVEKAYTAFKKIEAKCDENDSLYKYILWYRGSTASQLEGLYSKAEQFDKSLELGLEALEIIREIKARFDATIRAREFWMHKNIIVSYVGLGQLELAQKHKDILYQAYKEKTLPEGLEHYFNFTFFTFEGKNIWGYEWYPELGDPETKGSFSKIVYYVYSRNSDGTDKDQLYRLHVLKFHKFDDSIDFDYVLTKRLESATDEMSGTLYAYTYNKTIDYIKLDSDIREVLKGNYEPDVKTTIKKKR